MLRWCGEPFVGSQFDDRMIGHQVVVPEGCSVCRDLRTSSGHRSNNLEDLEFRLLSGCPEPVSTMLGGFPRDPQACGAFRTSQKGSFPERGVSGLPTCGSMTKEPLVPIKTIFHGCVETDHQLAASGTLLGFIFPSLARPYTYM